MRFFVLVFVRLLGLSFWLLLWWRLLLRREEVAHFLLLELRQPLGAQRRRFWCAGKRNIKTCKYRCLLLSPQSRECYYMIGSVDRTKNLSVCKLPSELWGCKDKIDPRPAVGSACLCLCVPNAKSKFPVRVEQSERVCDLRTTA